MRGPARGTGVDRHARRSAPRFPDAVLVGLAGPSAEAVGGAGPAASARRATSDDLSAAVPVYGRPPDITRPKTA